MLSSILSQLATERPGGMIVPIAAIHRCRAAGTALDNGHGRIPSRRVDHTKGSNQSIHTPHIDASPTGIQRGGPSDYRNSV